MRLVLDANALYWLLSGNARLGRAARIAVERATAISVSDVTLFEVSVKVSIGKLSAIASLPGSLSSLGIDRVRITDASLAALESLPLHHRDPFDRMLIAQALTENLTIVTSDPQFAAYGVRVVDARA